MGGRATIGGHGSSIVIDSAGREAGEGKTRWLFRPRYPPTPAPRVEAGNDHSDGCRTVRFDPAVPEGSSSIGPQRGCDAATPLATVNPKTFKTWHKPCRLCKEESRPKVEIYREPVIDLRVAPPILSAAGVRTIYAAVTDFLVFPPWLNPAVPADSGGFP